MLSFLGVRTDRQGFRISRIETCRETKISTQSSKLVVSCRFLYPIYGYEHTCIHNISCAEAGVESRVLFRVGWSDDRHQMEPVLNINTGIPNLNTSKNIKRNDLLQLLVT